MFGLVHGLALAQEYPRAGNWKSGFALPGIYGSVRAIALHGDHVYVGGGFLSAGSARSQSIACWNRSTGEWTGLGGGVDGEVWALAVGEDGMIYAGGDFSMAGSTPANNIARWDGHIWSALDEGTDETVSAIAVHEEQVYAGGSFLLASGIEANRVARWDGDEWHAMGNGIEGNYVAAIAIDALDNVYVGGRFTKAGGVSAKHIARWDGSEWSGLGEGMATKWEAIHGSVGALAVHRDTLYAGGLFTSAGGVSAALVASWDGETWHSMGDEFADMSQGIGAIEAMAVDENGKVYVGGVLPEAYPTNAAAWDGEAWRPLEHPFIDDILAIASLDGEIYLGGLSPMIPEGGNLVNQIYRYDGNQWGVMGGPGANGLTNHVYALLHDDSGTQPGVYAGGNFEFAGATAANGVARWDGSTWTPLGSGLGGPSGTSAKALALATNGMFYAGGRFEEAGSVLARNVAAWREDRWEALGGGLNRPVEALVAKSDTLYAGGWFTRAYNGTDSLSVGFVARWDGKGWTPVGGGVNGPVTAMALLDNGDLLVGGHFTQAGGTDARRIARWNGSSWSSLGAGMDSPVYAVAARGGDIYAGGNFTMAGDVSAQHIARWDGARWSELGGGTSGLSGDVYDLEFTRRGDLYVAGDFETAGDIHASNVARWDGVQWHALDGGVYGFMAHAVAVDDGVVYVGGEFSSAGEWIVSGGMPVSNFAAWSIPPNLSGEPHEYPSVNFRLYAPFPNPFQQTITIPYHLDVTQHVRLRVYDALGREIATLVDAPHAPGEYSVLFDAPSIPTGVYFCVLSTGISVETRRMIHFR
ncbi:MAG: T9SS type A sorting domain-containing protein [Rhodothermales bacterium]